MKGHLSSKRVRIVLAAIAAAMVIASVLVVAINFQHSRDRSRWIETDVTWTWDGSAYTQVGQGLFGLGTRPPAREYAGMAYDPGHRYVLLFGGTQCEPGLIGDGPCSDLTDTWTWDGGSWTSRQPPHSPDESKGSMVYDSSVHNIIYMTESGAGWAWDGNDWHQMWRATDVPQPAQHSGLEDNTNLSIGYDEAHKVLVVLSDRLVGSVAGSTTESFVTSGWDGSKWQQLASTNGDTLSEYGPNFQVGSMVFDRDRRSLVAMGIRYTWTWDGASWVAHAPGFADGEGLYDPVKHRTLWFGELADRNYAYGVSVWSGESWRELPSKNAAFGFHPSIAFDESRGVVVLFGGRRWRV